MGGIDLSLQGRHIERGQMESSGRLIPSQLAIGCGAITDQLPYRIPPSKIQIRICRGFSHLRLLPTALETP